ncbi:hypothetical protein B7463_g8, partial [Scytalidium lignicola]
MGWFWADSDVSLVNSRVAPHPMPVSGSGSPPPSCPMHKHSADALKTVAKPPPAETACPYTPGGDGEAKNHPKKSSTFSKLNPLNYMFPDLSQDRAANQAVSLPTEREPSSIPKGTGDGNWEYPSPQQMYNALLRKGYTDTDITAVESMVSVHNFLNEGAWAEIVEWERRFGGGLGRGWEISKRGEENALATRSEEDSIAQPKLIRFQGRPQEMTPKAAMIQLMGWIYPSKFGSEPPFDRHDWFVQREYNGEAKPIRYVIDYYSGPPEPTGEPVFYLDVRPAVDTPTAAIERMMRWGGDVWYRASGASVREQDELAGENTDTLVLTSAGKHYVDIRIFKPTDSSQPALPVDPSDNDGIKRLEWGFAGTSTSSPAEYEAGKLIKPSHTVWRHWVDNKTIDSVEDEGDMFPIENSSEVLEKGAMVNPATGIVTNYEELWEDLDPIRTGNEEQYVSWVLKTEKPDPYVRGKAIRIAQFIEAVLRVGDTISVARWKWDVKAGWQQVLAIGKLDLSTELFGEEISIGKVFPSSTLEWECIESYKWS